MKKTILTSTLGLVCAIAFGQTDEDQDLLLARKAIKTNMVEKSIEKPTSNKEHVIVLTPVSTKPQEITTPVYASTNTKPVQTIKKVIIEQPIIETENKHKLKLAFYVNGDRALTSRGIFRSDQQIELKAFTFVNKLPLVITDMNVDLIREGRKISSTTLGSTGNLDSLLSFAKPGDQFTITVKEVFETTTEGHLRSYAKGNLYLNIPFVN